MTKIHPVIEDRQQIGDMVFEVSYLCHIHRKLLEAPRDSLLSN